MSTIKSKIEQKTYLGASLVAVDPTCAGPVPRGMWPEFPFGYITDDYMLRGI